METATEEATKASSEFKLFLDTGIYRLRVPPPTEKAAAAATAVFVDPVRVLDDCYTRFRVSRCNYYTRSFDSSSSGNTANSSCRDALDHKRKKRRKRSPAQRELNEKERAAERRHQEARPLLLAAHKAFLEASSLQATLPYVVKCEDDGCRSPRGERSHEQNFVTLGGLWQAPLYEIALCFKEKGVADGAKGHSQSYHGTSVVVPLFNNFVANETNDDVEAEFGNNCYILPCRSSFYMSDLQQVRNLIPAHTDGGFNLIVIDPPWENGSVNQKAAYPTMPNRYFLYIPVKEIAHREGALVALWMTNREKLHMFVEKELFPSWGVKKFALFYWLKVAPNGSLICDLDLFHHRPYECLLLGYVNMQDVDSEYNGTVEHSLNNQVIISIPGAYSRKPPLQIMDLTPGPKPVKCIELFARELMAGWTSWGNETLRFQDSMFFIEKGNDYATS